MKEIKLTTDETNEQQLQIREMQKNQLNLYLPPVKITTPFIIVLEVENGSAVTGQYQDAKT
jgi:hypothetical protein